MEKPDTSPIRALVVDDQEVGRDLLMEMLLLFKMNVHMAESGEEALKEYALRDFDCIFIDIKMPDMDGFQLVREIRRRELAQKKPRTNLVAYSADIYVDNTREISRRDLAKFKTHGFDYCIPKPVKKKDIEAFIVQHLADRAPNLRIE